MGATGNITAPPGAATGNATGASTLDAAKKARLQKAVKDFEAIFLGMMMKSMRSSVPKDDAIGESFGGDLMESMFDEEVAHRMAGRSNLGLADMLYRSITHEPMPATPVAPPQAPQQAGAPPPQAGPAPTQAGASTSVAPPKVPSQARQQASTQTVTSTDPAANSPAAPAATENSSAGKAPVIAPPHAVRERVAAYEDLIQQASAHHGVDSTIIKAVMAAESGGDRTAVSAADAKGLMQLTDSTAVDMGVRNVWNARENIQGGTRYLQSLLERFDGDTRNAIASYNAGPARVEKHGGVPPIPETQAYVRRVMNYIQYYEQEEASHEGR
ncbi:MAG TPA: transglycosylase SLT domain-containing protein [Bacteroidota bacterium]|nr:transglycosylase SLT domain-containing protein [Bacteroidota bacterium]